jgi:hypothetical protein
VSFNSIAWRAMAAWRSRSVHILSKAAASIHVPSQAAHSSRSTSPMRIQCMSPPHDGHFVACGFDSSVRLRAAPHEGQNAAP